MFNSITDIPRKTADAHIYPPEEKEQTQADRINEMLIVLDNMLGKTTEELYQKLAIIRVESHVQPVVGLKLTEGMAPLFAEYESKIASIYEKVEHLNNVTKTLEI